MCKYHQFWNGRFRFSGSFKSLKDYQILPYFCPYHCLQSNSNTSRGEKVPSGGYFGTKRFWQFAVLLVTKNGYEIIVTWNMVTWKVQNRSQKCVCFTVNFANIEKSWPYAFRGDFFGEQNVLKMTSDGQKWFVANFFWENGHFTGYLKACRSQNYS